MASSFSVLNLIYLLSWIFFTSYVIGDDERKRMCAELGEEWRKGNESWDIYAQ